MEKFSIYKYYYYLFQTMKVLQYLHDEAGIVYCKKKPQKKKKKKKKKIKIGDFGVSIVLSKKNLNKNYKLKGLTF